jgi:hypothetical protein
MRSLVTVLGCCAGSALVTLVLAWPSPTYADPPEALGEGILANVTFRGELARDASVRSGWIAHATFENSGDEDATTDIDLEVTRATVSPDVRTIPGGLAVWTRSEHAVVPAHGHVMRSEEVPVWLGAQLGRNERATVQAIWVGSQLAPPDPGRDVLFRAPGFRPPTRPFTLFQVGFRTRNVAG